MEIRRFLGHAFGVGAISVGDRVVTIALGVVLARTMGPEDYGLYALVMVWIGLLIIPAKLGVPELITRELSILSGRSRSLPVWHFLACGGVRVLAASCILGVLAVWLLHLAAGISDTLLLISAGAIMVAWPLLDVVLAGVRGIGLPTAFQALGTLLPSAATLALVALCMIFFPALTPGEAATARAIGLMAAISVTLGYLCFKVKIYNPLGSVRTAVPPPWRLGLSFVLLAALNNGMMRADVVVLGFLGSSLQVGLYRVASEGALLVGFAYSIASSILAPEYAKLQGMKEHERLQKTVKFSARLIFLGGAPVSLALICFPAFFISLIFGAEYADAAIALQILAAGHLFTLLLGDPVFVLSMGAHQQQAIVGFSVGLISCLLLSATLIPFNGIAGAAIASSAALIIMRLHSYICCRRMIGVDCSIF
jgi:O-antigen/teichoic acid export membrane protein